MQHLKNLETIFETVRAASAPKSNFSFKRRSRPTTPAVSSSQAAPTVPTLVRQNTPQLPNLYGSAHLSLCGYSHRYLSLSSLSCPSSISSDLTISDLDHCIVNLVPPDVESPGSKLLSPPVITALHARNINNTILILPIIKGSALLHDLKHCIVAVGCHQVWHSPLSLLGHHLRAHHAQFRMHASSHVDVYLSIPSNPIIEHCANIRFAAYPATFRTLIGDDARSVCRQLTLHPPPQSETIRRNWKTSILLCWTSLISAQPLLQIGRHSQRTKASLPGLTLTVIRRMSLST